MATSSSNTAGTVVSVAGEVRAVAADGTSRILQAGDRVFTKEVIATTANAVVQVHLENGRLFDLGQDSTAVVDDLLSSSGTAASPVRDSPHLEDAQTPGAPVSEPARITTEAPAESGNDEQGIGNPVMVVEQANTGAQVASGFTADPVSSESAMAEAGKNPLQEGSSFLVQDGPLFPPPVVAASGARTVDKESAGSVAESRGELAEVANTAAGFDPPAHGGADSDAPAEGDRLAPGDLLQGDQNANDLTTYLSFTYDAHTNSTTVNVHPASGGGDHKIVLMGVDLTSGGTLTTDSIIQTLLSHGKLHSDT